MIFSVWIWGKLLLANICFSRVISTLNSCHENEYLRALVTSFRDQFREMSEKRSKEMWFWIVSSALGVLKIFFFIFYHFGKEFEKYFRMIIPLYNSVVWCSSVVYIYNKIATSATARCDDLMFFFYFFFFICTFLKIYNEEYNYTVYSLLCICFLVIIQQLLVFTVTAHHEMLYYFIHSCILLLNFSWLLFKLVLALACVHVRLTYIT